MRYFSMFSGIGGFEYGILHAELSEGIQSGLYNSDMSSDRRGSPLASQPFCIGFSEVDKYAISIYQTRFPEHKGYGDATKIDPEQLPDFDLLVGGFPCQAFSVAGKRGGFSDTRGTMFFEVARIIKQKQPRLLVLENVKGLLSHNKGITYATIISTLDELGYDTQRQTLNSSDFGVPQNRERVFIIGSLRGTRRPKIFPFRKGDRKNIASSGKAQSKIIDPKYLMRDCKVYNEECPTMAQRDYKEPFIVAQVIKQTQQLPDAQRIREIDGLASTLKGEGGGQGAKTGLYAIPVLTPDRPEKRQNGRRMKEDGDPSFTLTAQDRHGVFDGYRIRRLTPKECERLQGFPDGWTNVGGV